MNVFMQTTSSLSDALSNQKCCTVETVVNNVSICVYLPVRSKRIFISLQPNVLLSYHWLRSQLRDGVSWHSVLSSAFIAWEVEAHAWFSFHNKNNFPRIVASDGFKRKFSVSYYIIAQLAFGSCSMVSFLLRISNQMIYVTIIWIMLLNKSADAQQSSQPTSPQRQIWIGEYPPGCDPISAQHCEDDYLNCILYNGPANDAATICSCSTTFYSSCLPLAGEILNENIPTLSDYQIVIDLSWEVI